MGILSKIFGASPLGAVVNTITDVIGGLFPSADDKARFDVQKGTLQLEIEKVLQARDTELEKTFRIELEAKQSIIVAELQQGDNYTKRARPTVIYFGLFFFFFNYSIVPLFGLPQLDIPVEFMYGWSGIVGTYAIGRSAERVGVRNRAISAITGNKSMLDL